MADGHASAVSRRTVLKAFGGAALVAIVGSACRDGGSDASGSGDAAMRTNVPPAERLVRQVDHVLLRTDDAAALFDRLSNDLALPVAWPLFTYRGFLSGAVSLGKVNLEVLQHKEGAPPPFAAAPGTYPIGLGFEPVSVDGAVRELDVRGIEHSAPFEDGINDAIRWTSIDLTGPAECPIMLFVKYAFDQEARRAQLAGQLRERQGGPLGIERAVRVELGVRDVSSAGERWQRFFAPDAATPQWAPAAGPAVQLVEGEADRFERIVIGVPSLEAAVGALRERRMLGEVGDAYADIDFGDGHRALRLVAAV